jgi:hypothetical protein
MNPDSLLVIALSASATMLNNFSRIGGSTSQPWPNLSQASKGRASATRS